MKLNPPWWFRIIFMLLCTLLLESSVLAIFNPASAQFEIELGSTEIRENSIPEGSGNVGVGDFIDDQGNLIDYELVDGEGSEGNGFFFIRKKEINSQLQATPRQGFDFEEQAAYNIRVRASLAGTILEERTFAIDVLNEEEPPTEIILSNSTVEQGAEEDTEVGILSVTGGAPVPIEFSLVGEDDLFELEDNVLKVEDDFEDLASGDYPVTIRATGDGSIDSTFTITVTNVEEPPSNITLTDSTFEENQPVGMVIGTLAASSGTVDPEDIIFDLVAGGDEFSIVGKELQTNREFDFEEDPEIYVIEVVAQGDGDSDPKTFTITLTNVLELPAAFELDNKSIAESQPIGSTVGNFIPVDAGVTYSLVAGEGSDGNDAFSILNQLSGSELQTAQVLDYENQDSYSIRVSAANAEGGTRDTTFVIDVIDEAENIPPVASAGTDILVTDTDRNGSEEVTLDASASTDDKGIVRYLWTLPDETILADTDQAIILQQIAVGTYNVILTVFDEEGEDSTDEVSVIVNQPPTAVASSDITNGEAPLTIAFSSEGSTNNGEPVASYEWSFGDGGTSTEESPSHTYTTSGTYLAMLTVTDEFNASAKDSVEIIVSSQNQAPVAVATATPVSGTAPLEVAFSSDGSEDEDGSITFSWDFGDGNSSEDASPTYTYDDPGEFTATLTVTDDDLATASASVTIAVNAPPTANAGDDQRVEADEDGFANVTLDGSKSEDEDGTIIRYDWREDVENGTLLVTSEESTVTVPLPIGEHLIVLVVEDNDMATASDAVMIYVDEPQNVVPMAAASANTTSGTAPLEVTFSSEGSEDGDGTIESYLWNFGDGETSTIASPSHTFTEVGTYSTTLTVTDNDGEKTTSDAILIEVTEAPVPEFILSPISVIVDEDFSGQQRVEAQLADNSQDVSFSIDPLTLDFATLTADNPNGVYLFESRPNSNGDANLTVRATDNITRQTYEQTLRFEVAAVNDAPIFALTGDEVTVAANSERQTVPNFATNIAPGPAEATDENGQTVNFTVTADNQELFSEQPNISPDGTLTYQVAENQAGSAEVLVTLQDDGAFNGSNVNTSEQQDFTINIEAPQASDLTLTGNTVPENQDGAEVGTLSFQGFVLAPSYSLPTGQADNDNFQISGDKLLTSQPLNFEERFPPEYQVVVEATSVFPGGTVSETFTVIVTDVAEPPTLVELDGQTIVEGQDVGTVIGTLSASGGATPPNEIT
ncbi:PKD domain-containing protein, partial [Tunicatimonas sp.]|uniref:PKD domain-containing protein n=1 Tax=Tunicatimonas sp. TaxID=1940096 RepID=UPI003C7283F8